MKTDIGDLLLTLLVVGVGAWILAAFVSPTLGALVALVGVAYVLYLVFRR